MIKKILLGMCLGFFGLGCVSAWAQPSPDQFFQICRTGSVEEVRKAIADGADVNALDKIKNPPWEAVFWSPAHRLEKMRLLVEAGANFENRNNQGDTALMRAAPSSHDFEITRYLISKGAAIDSNGSSALLNLFRFGSDWEIAQQKVIVKELLDRGAKINQTTDFGVTPLLAASITAEPEIVDLLLQNGAAAVINTPNKNGLTPLMGAAMSTRASPERLKLLLAHGADPSLRNKKGLSALDFAAANKNSAKEAMIAILQEAAESAVKP